MPPTAHIWILILCFMTFDLFSPLEPRAEQASASKTTNMGLPVGENAPPFKARDQFGQEQDNRKITGKNGTVLLFFRSADW